MSEILNALRADLAAAISDLDVGRVVTDTRNFTAPCLLIGLPSVTRIQTLQVEKISVDVPVHLVGPGPGNEDAVQWLLFRIIPLMEALRVTTANAATVEVGDRTFPAYDLDLNRVLDITPEGS